MENKSCVTIAQNVKPILIDPMTIGKNEELTLSTTVDIEQNMEVITPKKTLREKQRTLLRYAKNYFVEYSNRSSIHGIRYMCEKDRSGYERYLILE